MNGQFTSKWDNLLKHYVVLAKLGLAQAEYILRPVVKKRPPSKCLCGLGAFFFTLADTTSVQRPSTAKASLKIPVLSLTGRVRVYAYLNPFSGVYK